MTSKFANVIFHGNQRGTHDAVEVATFSLTFATPIDRSDLGRFEEAEQEIRKKFGAINSPPAFQIDIQGAQLTPADAPAKHLTEFGRDGLPTWSAIFGENQIVLTCHAYSRWKAVWPDASERLALLCGRVDPFKLVSAIDFSMTDAFTSRDLEALSPSKMLVAGNLVPEFLIGYTDPRWDFSHGSFERDYSARLMLTRLEARSGLEAGAAVARIGTLHSFRPEPMVRLRDLVTDNLMSSAVTEVMNSFHAQNKQVLLQVLDPQLTERMGLAKEKVN